MTLNSFRTDLAKLIERHLSHGVAPGRIREELDARMLALETEAESEEAE